MRCKSPIALIIWTLSSRSTTVTMWTPFFTLRFPRLAVLDGRKAVNRLVVRLCESPVSSTRYPVLYCMEFEHSASNLHADLMPAQEGFGILWTHGPVITIHEPVHGSQKAGWLWWQGRSERPLWSLQRHSTDWRPLETSLSDYAAWQRSGQRRRSMKKGRSQSLFIGLY